MVSDPWLLMFGDVDGVFEFLPGVGDDSVGPDLICCQGHCSDAVTQAEDHQFGLSRWGGSGPLCWWRRGGCWFLFVMETPAHGEAVARLQPGHLMLPRCSGLAQEMDAQTRCFWYPIGYG